MASMNKALILGNLGKDPEVRFTQGSNAVCNFSVATNEKWKDKASGEQKERTEWHRIVAWGKTAELCGQYLKKGSSVLIEGRIQTREYEGKDGQKRWTTEIVADRVTFLGGKSGGSSAPSDGAPPSSEPAGPPASDDSCPF